ncbi:MAG: hypothetical protein ACJ72Z_10475 [Pyrinomonadaceae bacterium]
MTPEEHNKYISWTFLANGLFQAAIVLLVLLFVVAILAGSRPPDDGFPAVFLVTFFVVFSFIHFVLISPNFIAYYALKNRKPWARIASIVAAVLSAMNVPIGTASCVYALWFFFGEEWKALYPETAGASIPSHQIADAGPAKWEGHFVRQDGEVVYQPAEPPNWR